ncbi:hypothetical protein [Jiulongibacter sp. NS-SX5]|uniref:hypothetical protein n=1 Tax=Jiulongibacter sp. NS-SX5 TaxID=3463854 RepID=UPI004058B529
MTLKKIGIEVKSSPGSQGETGPEGHLDQGKVKFYWDVYETYTEGDIVSFYNGNVHRHNSEYDIIHGGLFICQVASSQGNAPVSASNQYHTDWKIIHRLNLPVVTQEEHTVIVSGDITHILAGCEVIIIPKNAVSSEDKFTLKMGGETGVGLSQHDLPKKLTIINGNDKGFEMINTSNPAIQWPGHFFESLDINDLQLGQATGIEIEGGLGIYDFIKKKGEASDNYGEYIIIKRDSPIDKPVYSSYNLQVTQSSGQMTKDTNMIIVTHDGSPQINIKLPEVDGSSNYKATPLSFKLYMRPSGFGGGYQVNIVDHLNNHKTAIVMDEYGDFRGSGLGYTTRLNEAGIYQFIKGQDLDDWYIIQERAY